MNEKDIVTRLRAAGCVFAEEEARLLIGEAGTPDVLAAMVERRCDGVPLEHVVGWAAFCGQRIVVDPGVFVPRRRTEFLVRQAAELVRPGSVVLDLCCGSGAVGAALAAMAPVPVELHAADIDPAATRCARHNVAAFSGCVYEGDLFAPLPQALRGRIDVLVANFPYVPTAAIGLMPPEARLHEPLAALDGGDDGLDVQRRAAAEVPVWLAPGGCLLAEAGERQASAAADIFARAGLDVQIASCDELDATVVIGTKRAHG